MCVCNLYLFVSSSPELSLSLPDDSSLSLLSDFVCAPPPPLMGAAMLGRSTGKSPRLIVPRLEAPNDDPGRLWN